VWELGAEDTGDDWETPYALFSTALLLGTLLTVVAIWIVSRHGERSLMRMVGLGVCVLAVLSSVVAWALPLWMTLSAVGYGLVAAAGAHPWRRAVALLSAAPVLGMVVLFLAIAAEVGRKAEYGDNPAAFGLATIVTAAATVGGLVQLGRSADALVTDTAADEGSVEARRAVRQA
jgi:MFS family permease